jgi:multidrug efflux pump subunit AcrA (membrane-fusion protein)
MTLEIQTGNNDAANGSRATLFDLKPGTFVNCKIIGETRENIFVLPRHLLKPGDILFIVNDSQLEKRQVTVLRKFEDQVYINGGLVDGDKIIVSPLPGAIEGMELIIRENEKPQGMKP